MVIIEYQPTYVSLGLEFTVESMAMYTDYPLALTFYLLPIAKSSNSYKESYQKMDRICENVCNFYFNFH